MFGHCYNYLVLGDKVWRCCSDSFLAFSLYHFYRSITHSIKPEDSPMPLLKEVLCSMSLVNKLMDTLPAKTEWTALRPFM